MIKTKSKLRFSIIIPLEFHRGQVEACLHRWAYEQTYPRDQYEVVAVGCKNSLDEATITFFKSLLNKDDRLLLFDEPHDMALCAYGARQAKGEVLFFTESHCLPEPNILSVVDDSLNIHPEWAGFSGQSLRITHNRLSIVEADMYEADIRYGMQEHPWRKILDQCFAVRANDYYDAGGFLPELGHFAEWHLAARMHQKGYQIGFVPEAQVHHYYIGDINELIEFSTDFVHGELIYQLEFVDDPCRSYFQEPLEWLIHYRWNLDLASKAFQLAWHAHSKSIRRMLHPSEGLARCILLLTLRAYPKYNLILSLISSSLRFQFARLVLYIALLPLFSVAFLRKTFIQLIDATIQLERVRFISNVLKKKTLQHKLLSPSSASSLLWTPDTSHPYSFFGFHVSEEWRGHKFKWSAPVGLIEVPLTAGNYQLKIEWLPIRDIKNLILYINENPVPTVQEGNTMKMSFQVTSNSSTYFSLTCEPWLVPNDKRLLGLPITSISITAQ